jgi:protein-tyrosine phosphatase
MNKIIDYLFIGSFEDAIDIKQLQKHNIKHIINVAKECNHTKIYDNITYEKYPIIEYYKPVNEDNIYDLNYTNLEKLFFILDNYIEKKEPILIHCAHGMSRSVTFVIYYLMKKNKLSTDEAFKFVINKRKIAYPCSDYILYLNKLEKY